MRLFVEVIIMWVFYALYMAVLVHKKGPIGGIYFYPDVVQKRTIELGLISEEELKKRRDFAFVLLFVWMFAYTLVTVLFVNHARSYRDCCFQFYVLLLGAEFFDWLIIDTVWVAMSDWWIIPGTEDLLDTWHSIHVKKWKFIKLIPALIPVALVFGGIFFGIGKLIG